ncbi:MULTISPECIES: carbohydrate ABC transporter permease [Micrococcaceae]|uniref:Carbohydrate ABC transporter permease n=1 Tax=Paenarthrobacter aromaticivorans TaxID=2849150 RepID=A0ABS6I9I7_9MICC|nr:MULTISPECIES: carbohydrate ABC transporter permease [Micrococcaceae]MBU8868090.1 carbohydrate ABC transporter permease [Paenarthrobacter sp. MMS21-TAE1-1]BCW08467.1 sugar ABC transporter permease [Arthrobacter sp. NtRootA1]
MSTSTMPRQHATPPQTTASERRNAKRSRRFTGTFTVNALLVIGCAYMVLPVLWLFIASTKNTADLYGTGAYAFGQPAFLDNVAAVLGQDGGVFLRWMANSMFYAAFGAVFGGLISVMAGYAFDKFQFRGKDSFFGVVLVGVLIPNTATVLPMYLLASVFGITNTVWAILIPVLCNPFGVYLARVYSAAYVPGETLEAARVDGAGPIRSFFSLGLPMMMPGYVTIALFQFVGVWNNFMLPLVMLQDQKLLPVSVGISIWQGYSVPQPEFTPMVITGSLLSIVPLLLAFVMLQRFWKSGLSAGSVK